MKKLLVKIIQLLDGTPAVYGKRQAGQSVVELALLTPILIILLAGLVEIGWFANNYLTLLDVTRAGARRGAVLQDQSSPLFWDNTFSYVPTSLLADVLPDGTDETLFQMPQTLVNGTDIQRFFYRWYPVSATDGGPAGSWGDTCLTYDPVTTTRFDRKFYNEVTCTMITTMDPLALNPDNDIDDIVVSGFAMQLVDPTANPDPSIPWLSPYYDLTSPQMVVAGRYPTNANECDVRRNTNDPDDPLDDTASLIPMEPRDPFDINEQNLFSGSGTRDVTGVSGAVFTEIFGSDPIAGSVANAEKQVGFSLFGNHKIAGTYCVGSEWTMQRIEALMNLQTFGLADNSEKNSLPSQGVVIAEIYWEHEMLLKIPVLSPVFTVVGNADGKMVINVWAAFPLSSVEPHIIFPS
ncbi:MAG: TadE/TadG family type IV pilus assembly protein [Chloroflexota bacterium]